MHQNYWKFQNRSVQTFGFVYHDTNGQHHGPVWKTQSFLLSEILTVIFWKDCWGTAIRESSLKYGLEKVPNWECLFVNREKVLFLSVYVDDIKLARKKQNRSPTWSSLMELQKNCQQQKPRKTWCRNDIFLVLRHGRSCKEMCGAILLANKTTQQLYKVSTPCIDDDHFKEEELKSVGELWRVCSQIVLKCLYLASIGRPDIFGQWISSHDPSQNGPRPVTNAWIDWFHNMWIQTILSCG